MKIRNFITILTVLLLAAMPALPSRARAGDSLTDEDKLKIIREMYSDYRKSFPDVMEISPQRAMQLHREGRALFLDVREEKEQEVSMLPDARRHEDFLDNPAAPRDIYLIAYCTIGYRSGKFVEKMEDRNVHIFNLKGGILGWLHAGGRIYDQKGESRRVHLYGKKWNLAPGDYQGIW